MNWEVRVHKKIGKYLKKIPKQDVVRVETALEQFQNNPFFGDIEKMEGEKNVWRRRIGAYRVFYEIFIESRMVFVFNVERRTTATYRKR